MSSLKPFGPTPIARLLATIYKTAVNQRNRRFDAKTSLSQKLPFPTISVGGIAAGGTGKTPMVSLICDYLLSIGNTPVILSRGYGRKSKSIEVVAPDEPADWRKTGDEPAMLHRSCKGIWLAIGADRHAAAKAITPRLPSGTVFILDDGFQRRDIARDLDILCLHPQTVSDRLIPMGTLREPLDNCARADLFCIIGGPEETDAMHRAAIELSRRFPTKPLLYLERSGKEILNAADTDARFPENFSGPIAALTGIARPERFSATLASVGITPDTFHTFPDHHPFTRSDLTAILAEKPEAIITTEKDLVRLSSLRLVQPEIIWYLTLRLRHTGPLQQSQFESAIHSTINKDRT